VAVGLDGAQGGVEAEHQLVVLAHDAAQQGGAVAHHVVEVEDLQLEHLLAAEGEQLAGQGFGAGAGLDDQLQAAAGLGIGGGGEQQAAVAVDDGEQVVEVVGDAAGEQADAFHLLRLAVLLLQPLVFGEVEEGALDALGLGLVGGQVVDVGEHQDLAAVGAADGELAVGDGAGAAEFGGEGGEAGEEGGGLGADQRLRGHAGDAGEGGVGLEHHAGAIQAEHAGQVALEELW